MTQITASQTHPLIPMECLESMSFCAPMWGIHCRQLESDPTLSWVQLVVDLGPQVYTWVLCETEQTATLMSRKTRCFTLHYTSKGVVITSVQTDGCAVDEVNGYAVALASV